MNINALNQLENIFDVDAGWREQVIGQRLAFKLDGFWIASTHLKDFTHQRVTVRVRAAGSQRNQHIAIGHFTAIDNF
ncbi:hypothetical protein D3C87_1961590 [compost metagenome]